MRKKWTAADDTARPWLPCVNCRQAPQHYYHRCRDCFREYNRKTEARKVQRRAERRARLEVHERVCVDCHQLFLSQRGFNLCRPCTLKVMNMARAQTLDRRGVGELSALHVRVLLKEYYGSRWYESSVRPRIPLSTLGVFESTGGKR